MTDPTAPKNFSPKLPLRISPCPIVQASIEVRFQTDMQPESVPGVIYAAVKERFPEQARLPGVSIPGSARTNVQHMRYIPVLAMNSDELSIYASPKSFSLNMKTSEYPGWQKYREALTWVLGRIRESGLLKIPEKMSLRYVDFFETRNLAECLRMELRIGGQNTVDFPLQVKSHLRRKEFICIVSVSTDAILQPPAPAQPKPGCLLDISMNFTIPPHQFWAHALDNFERAHQVQKEVFFNEMISPAWLDRCRVEY